MFKVSDRVILKKGVDTSLWTPSFVHYMKIRKFITVHKVDGDFFYTGPYNEFFIDSKYYDYYRKSRKLKLKLP